jgi:hypothetical protein
MLTKLYENDEISGRIFGQICNLFIEPILSDQKVFFYDYAFAIMHKLNATKYHLNNYKRIEKEQYERALQAFKKKKFELREALELIFELEVFLYQIKSSLDMLIKLMIPIVGKDVVSTKTYGNKGEDLIKGLMQYKKKKDVKVEAVDQLIELIRSDKDSWLEKVVSYRDELNHFKGLRNYQFEPLNLPNGEITVVKPSFKKINTVQFMTVAYTNNLEFHQDFLSCALEIKAPKGFILIPQDPEKAKKEFEDAGKYIKWAWGLVERNDQKTDDALPGC